MANQIETNLFEDLSDEQSQTVAGGTLPSLSGEITKGGSTISGAGDPFKKDNPDVALTGFAGDEVSNTSQLF